ncbi:MAG: hypothetical protein MJ180_02280 [Candidatus Gastranaerophilales bacterium]|nr:hypothetical protein [Candidatus Gastranaerophilales bacterium]
MKVSFTNLYQLPNLRNQNFNSRVIEEKSEKPLNSSIKDFIDTFEERFPKNKNSRRNAEKGYTNGDLTIFRTDAGESGQVFMVKSDNSSIPKFVIKESFPLKYKVRDDDDLGGLEHEYDAMCEAAKASDNTQKPIAYVKTENGSSFLLSKYMPNLAPINSKTSPDGSRGVEITPTYMKTALKILEEFDDADIFDPDLTRSNMAVDTSDGTAKALDFQWALLRGTHSKSHNVTFTFAPCEVETCASAFEAGVLADYPIGELKKLTKLNKYDNENIAKAKAEIRETLKDYLKLRGKYAEKLARKYDNDFEAVKAKVFKNPSDDVLDAELLRMSILRNNRLQFLYTDDNIERPRNMLKLVRYSALAKFSAHKLKNFEPQSTPRTKAETEYFEYMREFGAHWDKCTSKWYPETVAFLENVIRGYDKAPGRYFPELFDETKPEKFTLFSVLSNSAIDNGHSILKRKIQNLENNLVDLKEGEYVSSSDISSAADDIYCY